MSCRQSRISSHHVWGHLARAARLVFLGTVLVSCGSASSGGSDGDLETDVAQEKLYYANGITLWNNNVLGTAAPILVCFAVRPDLDDVTPPCNAASPCLRCPLQSATTDCNGSTITGVAALRLLLQQNIQDSWMRAANIELYGWGDCPIDAATNTHKRSAIPDRIVINFGPSDGAGVGKRPGGLVQPTFITYNHVAINNGSNFFNRVHEAGHALGFAHEWRRNDYPNNISGCGNGENTPVAGTYLTTFPDTLSKLQYCTPDQTAREDVTLSSGDILGIQKAYGRKYQGSIVGYSGQCMDIQGASTQNGTPVIAYPCRGQWNDRFSRPADTLEHFQSWSNNKCLNVQNGTAPNPIISWSCGNFANERFVFGGVTTSGAELRAMGNMCVSIVLGEPPKIQVCSTNESAAQRWDVQHANGSIRSDQIQLMGIPGTCLSTATLNGAMNEELMLAACSATDTKQRFTYPGNGVIKMANNLGLCLNVKGGKPDPGKPIILYNGCDMVPPHPNSQFHVHGRIKSLNHCLQIMGAGLPGNVISAQPCSASNVTTQIWDYYL